MRYSEITEAPIGNIEVRDMDKPGTFPDADRRLMSNPAHVEKIKKRFDLNAFQFDMYFVNQPGVEYTYSANFDDLPSQEIFTKRWETDLSKYGGITSPDILKTFGLSITPDPDSITVVYLSNANEENAVVMTPWIVGHRFGHALTDAQSRLPSKIQFALEKFPKASITPLLKEFGIDIPLRLLLTSRASRTGIMPGSEMFEELIAQYLIKGKVSLAIPSNIHGHYLGGVGLVKISQQIAAVDSTLLNDRLEKLGMRLTVFIEQILNECIGRVFIAV